MLALIKYWKYGLIILLGSLLLVFISNYNYEKKENVRKDSNITVLNSTVVKYKVALNTGLKKLNGKDSIISLNAAKIQSLTYTVDEFKRFQASDMQIINALNLKIKNVQSVTNVGTHTDQNIHTGSIQKDSTICFDFQDKWLTLSGCAGKKFTDISYHQKDSLSTVASRIPKHRFLWWTWGVKGIQLNIVSQNPNTEISYLKYIELKY